VLHVAVVDPEVKEEPATQLTIQEDPEGKFEVQLVLMEFVGNVKRGEQLGVHEPVKEVKFPLIQVIFKDP